VSYGVSARLRENYFLQKHETDYGLDGGEVALDIQALETLKGRLLKAIIHMFAQVTSSNGGQADIHITTA
jgi:hypothetical protein